MENATDHAREARILQRAYELWEQDGRPEGRHKEHWARAEAEIDSQVAGRTDTDRAADAAPGQHVSGENMRARQDQLLDEALEETFPSSDPISPKQIT